MLKSLFFSFVFLRSTRIVILLVSVVTKPRANSQCVNVTGQEKERTWKPHRGTAHLHTTRQRSHHLFLNLSSPLLTNQTSACVWCTHRRSQCVCACEWVK